jgi:hypothetical protein
MPAGELIQITAVSFIIQAIIVSALDFKYRDIKTHLIWFPLVCLNVPVLLTGYAFGYYPLSILPVSFIALMTWLACMHFNYLQGADAMWLSLTSIFIIKTPSGNLFFPTFLFFLIGLTAIALFYMKAWNKFMEKTGKPKITLPYLAVISLATIIAITVG